MPRTARRDGLERRETILDAALACFSRRGVLGTGIEDVRAAAKASFVEQYVRSAEKSAPVGVRSASKRPFTMAPAPTTRMRRTSLAPSSASCITSGPR